MPHPELDGLPPEFHATNQEREVRAAVARTLLGATRWPQDLNRPEPPWLIPGFLQSQAIHVISAPKAARKTWLGLYTMLCGIYGAPWLGTPSRPFESVYIAADSPRWDVRSQIRRLCLGMQVQPQSLASSGSFVLPYGFKFTNDRHCDCLENLITAWDIKAIFIDVLLYAYDGLNENDNSDMGALFQTIKYYRDNLGLAVVLLHHHAKDPSVGARGAGTILQAAEHHYELRRLDATDTNIRREKLRGDEEGQWENLRFSLARTQNGGRLLVQSSASALPTMDDVATYITDVPRQRQEIILEFQRRGRSARWTDTVLAVLRSRQLAVSEDGVWSFVGSPVASPVDTRGPA